MRGDQKHQLHAYLRECREAVTWKAQGLSEYDVRRPLTPTGTNLLGLIKHLAIVEAWYFGQTFDRPFTPRLPWWTQPEVTLHTMLVHVLAETSRHAGHADILRERLDGRTGMRAGNLNLTKHDDQWWTDYRALIEAAARSADPK